MTLSIRRKKFAKIAPLLGVSPVGKRFGSVWDTIAKGMVAY